MKLSRLWAIARKEAIQLLRDPRSLGMAFGVPALLLVLFSTVIRFDVNEIPMAVLDQDNSQQSRDLVRAFTASGYFSRVADPARADDAGPLLAAGTARMMLIIPPDFARDLASGQSAPVQALVDGSDANTAQIAMNYSKAIVSAWSATMPSPVSADTRVWYNEALRSTNMIVPGLIAVIMMVIATMLTALTVAREWERGTMEQLAATPVGRAEVIIGKLIPYLVIGMVDIVIAVVVGITAYQVPLRGNPVYLLIQAFLFLCGALGMGVAISAALKNQLFAMQVSMIATYLPSLLLSGLMFDLNAMPLPLRVISLIVPARYFIVVTRGVFLKGVGPAVLWPQSVGMVAFAIFGIALAVFAFRKTIGRELVI